MSNNLGPQSSIREWLHAVRASDLPPLTKLICFNFGISYAVDRPPRETLKEQMRDTSLTAAAFSDHLLVAIEAGYITRETPHGFQNLVRYRHTFPGMFATAPRFRDGAPRHGSVS